MYARPNEVSDFALQIAKLIDDADRRTEMGSLGRARLEKELAWSLQEEKLIAAYDQLTTAAATDG